MINGAEVKVECGLPDDRGVRLVLATNGTRSHRDRLNTDTAFHRQRFRKEASDALGLMMDQEVEQLEKALIAAADEADKGRADSLWSGHVETLADMESKQTTWMWDGYIPAGAISGIDGDPGLGKSQLTCDLAARVSRGDVMPPDTAPDDTFKRLGVLMLNAEDDPARTIRPRLEAAGADLSRIHILRSMTAMDGEEERPVTLPGDLDAIEQIINDRDVALVTIDPFVAYLDGSLNVNNDADVRRCLGQLAAVAERTGAAVLLVRHLNKKSGLSAVYRGGGSIGITGACRAVFMVGTDPADEDGRILAPIKSNLAATPASLRFSIESHNGTSRVRWGDACEVSAHDILGAQQKQKGSSKLDEAKSVIADVLGNGPRGSNEVEQACRDAGISDSTYRRARSALRVLSEKTGFDDGQWLLSLPDSA